MTGMTVPHRICRVVGTQLQNPDFALYARAFGGHGERVERTVEFAPAFERASLRQARDPALPGSIRARNPTQKISYPIR
jgi:thiamine pyrophosphate-dependent acetolactate synthase large subunit-like protein